MVSALAAVRAGCGLAYCTLPEALEFLQSRSAADDIVTAYSPQKYFALIVYMMLAFGVGFEFPIVLVFLQMVGVARPRRQLRQCRRYAIVGIGVLVAVITPAGDPISLLALSRPDVHLLRDLDPHRPAHGRAAGAAPSRRPA